MCRKEPEEIVLIKYNAGRLKQSSCVMVVLERLQDVEFCFNESGFKKQSMKIDV